MRDYIGVLLDQRYQIIEVIGSGGMAVVYKAKDIKLNRYVAVKILKDEIMNDDELRQRFHTESEAVATLNHANIVKIFDVSFKQDIEYIVMELVDGITLKQYMVQCGVLNEKETLDAVTQILRALEHAHSRNIIHRDIKPQNVMILRDGEVRVTDFGIARIMSRQQTVTQNAFGSVHYIAPEQARGAATDGRADIYSVGIMMFEMLTGQLPFQGETPMAVAIQHLSEKPPNISTVNPSVSEGLGSIVMRAMACSPDDRYPSAKALLSDIEKYRNNPADFEEAYVPLSPKDADTERHSRSGKPEREPKAKKYNDKLPILAGVLSAVVFMIVAVIVFLSMFKGCNGDQNATNVLLPSLTGKQYDDVVASFAKNDEYKNLVIKKGAETYSETYKAGEIISQEPASGFRVKSNATVTLDVSLGERSLSMIVVSGIDYGEAKNKLTSFINQNRLTNVAIAETFETSDTVARDIVIRTEPDIGEAIKSGDTIQLFISTGTANANIIMPNLHTYTLQDAKDKLSSLSLSLADVTEDFSTADVGTVIGQSVKADTEIPQGTSINLIISKGPKTDTEPPPDEGSDSTSSSSASSSATATATSTSTASSSSTSTATSSESSSNSSATSPESTPETSGTSESTSSSSSSSSSSDTTASTGERRAMSYTIALPPSPESFTLTLCVDGTQIKEDSLSASDGEKTYNLQGVIGKTYVITVYIDGEFYKGESVTF